MIDTDLYHDWEGDATQPIFCIVFGIMAITLLIIQMIFLSKLRILPAYALPLLSFCLAFINISLYFGESIKIKSPMANTLNLFQSLVVPLFVLVLFEMTFRLHEARSAKFCYIPFDQQTDVVNDWGLSIKMVTRVPLWFIRVVVSGLFAMNILVYYRFVTCTNSNQYVGKGGYMTLADHPTMTSLWLALIPPMFLSALGLYMALVLYKYGVNFTISLAYNRRWRIIIPCIIAYTIAHIFGTKCYTTTSNAGSICLLIGLSFILFLIQKDLALAGSFADFLHRSNLAFDYAKARELQLSGNDVAADSTSISQAESVRGVELSTKV